MMLRVPDIEAARSGESNDTFCAGRISRHIREAGRSRGVRKKRIARADDNEKGWTRCALVWKDENCRYLTDLRPQLIAGKTTALNGALLVDGRAPILFCSGGERDRVDRTMPWIEEAHTIPIIEEKALVEGMIEKILGPVLTSTVYPMPRWGWTKPTRSLSRRWRGDFPNCSSRTAILRCSRRA